LDVKALNLKTVSALVILTLFMLFHGAYQGHAANDEGRKIYYTLFNPTLLWFLLGLALIFLELVVPGVILVFFGIGAWVAAVTTYLGLTASFQSQLLVFAVTSILLLVILRKWIKGKFYGHVGDVQDQTKNLDEFSGQSVVVLEDVIPNKMEGAVEFKGARWRAVSDEHIKKGAMAIITGVDGIILNVRKKEEG
jgi:membrane protein implicated in regulation of membrane protease activity